MDFYNDNDRTACAWLRELIREGLIPEGVVDERPIQEIKGSELVGYRRVHLFAGIGGWAYALELAGWPADRPVWTGSCPCQPFSAAGKRKGEADERHLWPFFHRLIRESRPATVFGEQVASSDGYRWLAGVQHDLEEEGFAFGAADLPACSQGAPHIRNRLFWLAAGAGSTGRAGEDGQTRDAHRIRKLAGSADDSGLCRMCKGRGWYLARFSDNYPTQCRHCMFGRLDDTASQRTVNDRPQEPSGDRTNDGILGATGPRRGRLANSDGRGCREKRKRGGLEEVHRESAVERLPAAEPSADGRLEHANGKRRQAGAGAGAGAKPEPFWANATLISCRDGKARRVEPGIFPLAHGVSGRVGILRGAGNSIVPQVAAAFIRAYLETKAGQRG